MSVTTLSPLLFSHFALHPHTIYYTSSSFTPCPLPAKFFYFIRFSDQISFLQEVWANLWKTSFYVLSRDSHGTLSRSHLSTSNLLWLCLIYLSSSLDCTLFEENNFPHIYVTNIYSALSTVNINNFWRNGYTVFWQYLSIDFKIHENRNYFSLLWVQHLPH